MSPEKFLAATDAPEEQIILWLKEALQQEGKVVINPIPRYYPGTRNLALEFNRLDKALEEQDETLKEVHLCTSTDPNIMNSFDSILKKSKKLTTLGISTNITENAAQSIAHLLQTTSTLTCLDVSNAEINIKTVSLLIQAINANNTLTSLKLNNAQITTESISLLMEALKENKNEKLNTLDFSGITILPEAAAHLAQILKTTKTITNLKLTGAKMGNESLRLLMEALKENTSLVHLDLSCLNSDLLEKIAPSTVILLANCLKTNTSLTHLKINGLLLEDEHGVPLANALEINSTLEELDISHNALGMPTAKAFAKALTKNTHLKTLYLFANSLEDEGIIEIAQAIKTNKTLTHLNLEYIHITDKSAIHLAHALRDNSHLRELSLNFNGIGDEGANAIASALETNNTLTLLNLIRTQIGEKGVDTLLNAIEKNFSLLIFNITQRSEWKWLERSQWVFSQLTGKPHDRLIAYLNRNRKLANKRAMEAFSKKLSTITPLNKDLTELITQYVGVLPKIEEEEAPEVENPSPAPEPNPEPAPTPQHPIPNTAPKVLSLFDKFKNGIHRLYTAFVTFCSTCLQKLKQFFSSKKEPAIPAVKDEKAPSTTVSVAQTSDNSKMNTSEEEVKPGISPRSKDRPMLK